MRLRLYGDLDEVTAAVDLIRTVLDVRSVSRPYDQRDHTTAVRVYVTAALPAGHGVDPDPTAPRCPWCQLPYMIDALGPVEGGMAWTCRRCDREYAVFGGLIAESQRLPVEQVRVGDWVFVMPGFRRVVADPTEAGGLVTVTVAAESRETAAWIYQPRQMLHVIRPSTAAPAGEVLR